MKLHVRFQLAYLNLTLVHAKEKVSVMHISTVAVSEIVAHRAHITITIKAEVTYTHIYFKLAHLNLY